MDHDRFAYAIRNPRAYPIHERCWVLMTRILDENLIKAHLDLFVKAMHQRTKNKTGYISVKVYDLDRKLCDEMEWRKWKDIYGDLHLRDPKKYIQCYTRELECSDRIYALRDPVKVVDVRDLIREEETGMVQPPTRKKNKDKNDKKQKPRGFIPCHRMVLRSSSTLNPLTVFLPPELILMIADNLADSKEIRLLLWAFPHWSSMIPESYWRTRFTKDFMLDYGVVPDIDALDWRRLYFRAGCLYETSHGLRNRRRIMRVLEGTKGLFLRYVADEDRRREMGGIQEVSRLDCDCI